MGDFFHGWRRKTGCVTLVMSVVLTMFWASSYSNINLAEDYYPDLESNQGNIEYTIFLDSRREVQWKIHYSRLVVPLILLSAYLLLSKPRTVKPSPNPAKISIEHTTENWGN